MIAMKHDERVKCHNEPARQTYDPSSKTMDKDGYEVLASAKTQREYPYRRDMRATERAMNYPIPYGNED